MQRDKYANKNKYWRNCFGIIINFYINTCVSFYIYIYIYKLVKGISIAYKVDKFYSIFVLVIIWLINIVLFFYPYHTQYLQYSTTLTKTNICFGFFFFFFWLLFYLFQLFLSPFLSLFLVFLSFCCPRVLLGGSAFSHIISQVRQI